MGTDLSSRIALVEAVDRGCPLGPSLIARVVPAPPSELSGSPWPKEMRHVPWIQKALLLSVTGYVTLDESRITSLFLTGRQQCAPGKAVIYSLNRYLLSTCYARHWGNSTVSHSY